MKLILFILFGCFLKSFIYNCLYLKNKNKQFEKKVHTCKRICSFEVKSPEMGEMPAMGGTLHQSKIYKNEFICACSGRKKKDEKVGNFAYFEYIWISWEREWKWNLICSTKKNPEKKQYYDDLISKKMNFIEHSLDVLLEDVQKSCKENCQSIKNSFKHIFSKVTSSLFNFYDEIVNGNFIKQDKYSYACICKLNQIIKEDTEKYYIRDYGLREKSEEWEKVKKKEWKEKHEKRIMRSQDLIDI